MQRNQYKSVIFKCNTCRRLYLNKYYEFSFNIGFIFQGKVTFWHIFRIIKTNNKHNSQFCARIIKRKFIELIKLV